MTRQQQQTIRRITDQLESDRFEAEQAAREQAELDPRSVLLTALELRRQGREDEARALVNEWRANRKGN